MSLSPATVAAGQLVSLAVMGDRYDEVIASATKTGKTITLESGRTARWNAKRSRFQIGQACSRGYATCVVARTASRLDPHH